MEICHQCFTANLKALVLDVKLQVNEHDHHFFETTSSDAPICPDEADQLPSSSPRKTNIFGLGPGEDVAKNSEGILMS